MEFASLVGQPHSQAMTMADLRKVLEPFWSHLRLLLR
jgi:hypothetical protein